MGNRNMSIRTRLIASFVFIECLYVFATTLGYLATKRVTQVEDQTKFVNQYGNFSFLLALILIAFMTITVTSIIRSIRLSVKSVTDAAAKLAEGDTNVKLEKVNNDEFGELIDKFAEMIEINKAQDLIVESIADGDMTVVVKPKSSKDVLGNSLKKLVDTNLHALTNIDDAAGTVMTSASEVASASEALAQGSTEQASAIEQITASIDDVAERTKQNAKEANNAASLMRDAHKSMEVGNESMKHMVDAMTDINNASESISKIIKVIDDIAFQTNILALNAAVEAARAGDAGMGFAVVAEEVRSLAAKSSQAAAETAELIEDSIKKIQAGSVIAGETAEALEEISKIVLESESIVNGIADSSDYQATAIEQIDQAVGQVSMVVQTNSATSEECAAASVELSNQASKMRGLLGVYKLGNNNSAPSASSYSSKPSTSSKSHRNEQIISLGSGFGKY